MNDLERNYYILKEVIIGIGYKLHQGNPVLAEYEVSWLIRQLYVL